ncbi:hypothetical protein GL263_23750 [Streptomyces durbertensis]|uniref:Uncharacterized protein n=1 Tax=Streptomyces durbertensis TaxID=2448886 RepID=A0ABR6EMH3_9ACTN|nr:hypothetical protein [Streptomyces durbertensis]MBB1246541.1 hypothetical protein [Streptomyces durbertensis]
MPEQSVLTKAVMRGAAYGALAFCVSVVTRASLYDDPVLSRGNVLTFAVVAPVAAAATWYGSRSNS